MNVQQAEQTTVPEDLISIGDASRAVNCNRESVRRAIHRGLVKTYPNAYDRRKKLISLAELKQTMHLMDGV